MFDKTKPDGRIHSARKVIFSAKTIMKSMQLTQIQKIT